MIMIAVCLMLIVIDILFVVIELYFFYIVFENHIAKLVSIAALLLFIICRIAILFPFILSHIIHHKKEKKMIEDIVIVPFYKPPINIHPSVAGFLIDKKIGKREFYTALFHSIIKGFIVIDEKIVNGNYKYYLLKNKGFKKSISCDRLVLDSIFYSDGRMKDFILFENIRN